MKTSWHLRFGVTANCNFHCIYCNPSGLAECHKDLTTDEVLQIAQAAYVCGMRRMHWTGGEPTLRNDFVELVRGVKNIGYTEQIVTTNGYRLHSIMEECVKSGLTRVIVSLDTLDSERNLYMTGNENFAETVRTLKESARLLPTTTKMNVATMRSTLPELPMMVNFLKEINCSLGNIGKVILKLIEFCPSNPAQLSNAGQVLYKAEWVSEDEIMSELAKIGKPVMVAVEGDNPSCRYYNLQGTDVIVGVLAMASWQNPCGRCFKMRITPLGKASACLQADEIVNLKGLQLDEQVAIIHALMENRYKLDVIAPARKHYRAQLGEMRFGSVGVPVENETFDKLRGCC